MDYIKFTTASSEKKDELLSQVEARLKRLLSVDLRVMKNTQYFGSELQRDQTFWMNLKR